MAAVIVSKKKLTSKELTKSKEASIPIARLWELLDPDFETGILRWKVSTNGRIRVGQIAGSLGIYGYLRIRIEGKHYQAHRILYAMYHGAWPSTQIDHINGIRSDNSIENLREATQLENMRNAKRPNTNSSGIIGTYWNKREKKWRAYIYVNRRNTHLGYFHTLEEAATARKAAEIFYGFHKNHGR